MKPLLEEFTNYNEEPEVFSKQFEKLLTSYRKLSQNCKQLQQLNQAKRYSF